METINWVVLYCLAPIFLGILGNILTPWAIAFLSKGNLSLRQKRLDNLIGEYRRIQRYRRNTLRMIMAMVRYTFFLTVVGIAGIGFVVMWIAGTSLVNDLLVPLSYVGVAFSYLVLLAASYLFLGFSGLLSKFYGYEEYREKTIAKIEKLGGNPKELDEIDREIEEEQKSPF